MKSIKKNKAKPKNTNSIWSEIFDFILGEKIAAAISFVGGILLIASTKAVPGLGTDGHGNLNFGKSPYYFVAEVSPQLTRIGILLIIIGFLIQIMSDVPIKWRAQMILIVCCLTWITLFFLH